MLEDPQVFVPVALVFACILIAVLGLKFGKAFRRKGSEKKSSLAEALGLKYVEGMAALEEAYREAGDMGMQALEWIEAACRISRLARPEAKESIFALLAANHGAFVTEKVVQWEKRGRHLDAGLLGPALELVARTAASL